MIHDQKTADSVDDVVTRLSIPAPRDLIATEAVHLISQYFVGEDAQATRKWTANAWLTHLSKYPAWAVERAALWWIGPENEPKARARRPQPGDIAEVAARMMHPVKMAEAQVQLWSKYRGDYPAFLLR